MLRRRRITLTVTIATCVFIVCGVAVTIWAGSHSVTPPVAPTTKPMPAPKPEPKPEKTPEPEEPAPPAYDIDSPASITVVVNKLRPLNPIDWVPEDLVYPDLPNTNGQPLRAEAAAALEAMNAEASAAGVPLIIASGYRSYGLQESLFSRYAASDGVAAAETYSARPGHSEHQTGLAVDLTDGGACTLEECFGETTTGIWLREHAWRFGFILRYENGEQPVVGYLYEPWHFRYVGADVARAMHEQGIKNLEDFFGLPAAPSYG